MKKLATLFACVAMTFSVGCAEAEKAAEDAKSTASEKAGDMIDEGAEAVKNKAPEGAGDAIDSGADAAKKAVGAE